MFVRLIGTRAKWTKAVAAVGLLAAALVVVPAGPAAAAPEQARARRSTPELLEDAVARREIDQRTADLYLARVFAGRGIGADVPARLQSDAPWRGTLPLLRLKRRLAAEPDGPSKAATSKALAAATTCYDSTASLPNETTSTHFYLNYGTIAAGLTAATYLNSLEGAWSKEVTSYGWAAPPVKSPAPPAPIGTKYVVRAESLGSGLYGFVSTDGTGAGFVGNNPNTAWDEGDAYASCMVLNSNYSGFPGSPQRALDSTTAHEFNHSIQFGLGAFDTPDDSMFEGGATWMEDEVYDAADDNHNYLWPNFRDSMGDYEGSPYAFWLMLRGLTERFGSGVAGGGEQVMQDYWENTSKNAGAQLHALAPGLINKGITLQTAYHDFAIGAGFMKTCGGGYLLPYCFEEAAAYVANVGSVPPVAGSIPALGNSFSSTIEDDLALAWVTVPAANSSLTLTNTSSGGELRATAVCDTGTALARSPFPAVVGAGASTTLAAFSGAGCTRTLAVITNQQLSPGNPSSSPSRGFTLSAAAPSGGAPATLNDFDGDGDTDRAVYRNGAWYVLGQTTVYLGLSGDIAVPADYDGDGDADRAVFRNGAWYVDGQPPAYFGLSGDIPVPGDYDGDGDTDRAIFRPSVGGWYVEGQPAVFLGVGTDIPVPGDYDGDGDTEPAVFRDGAWYAQGQATQFVGLAGHIPVPGDYDGDGDTDRSTFNDGAWYLPGAATVFLGEAGHVPQPGDYDGNGSTDRAVYAGGTWYTQSQATVYNGLAGDIPLSLPQAIHRRFF